MRNPRYLATYCFCYWRLKYIPDIKFLQPDEISNLVSSGKSIIRFGDGEIYLLNYGDIPFAKSTKKIRDGFWKIIKSYDNSSPYVIALNPIPLQCPNKFLLSKNLLTCWLPSKVCYNLYFNKQASYADAAMFYYRSTIKKYFEKYFLTKKLMFVGNKKQIDFLKNNKNLTLQFNKYIEVPETGAQFHVENIKNDILNQISGFMNDWVVLVSFGPSAKVVAYELSLVGVQVIDVGQGIVASYNDEDHPLVDNLKELQ